MHAPAHRPTRRRLLGLAARLCALAPLAGTCSLAQAGWPIRMATLEVFDRDSGQVLPVYAHDGRQFVPGRPGARYALRLRNLTRGRLLVVLSVDGVNVVSGETADWQQTGYVLDPGRSHDINGWRKSGTEVAAFEFAPIERSYAALTGRSGHVGVIGMAVFRERTPPPVASPPVAPPLSRQGPREEEFRDRADAAAPPVPAAPAAAARERSADKSLGEAADAGSRLGTGHGPREWSVSRRTHFERATAVPEQLSELAYDSLERLVAAGIVPGPVAVSRHRPRPFPGNAQDFVPDPPLR